MARETQIGGDGKLFVGEDKRFKLLLVDEDEIPVDMAGMTLSLVIATSDTKPALFTKTGTVTGTYNVDPLVNTQFAFALLTDDEMDTLRGKTYRYSWKRYDAGFDTIVAYGDFVVEKATAP